jgi:hypothetical protein
MPQVRLLPPLGEATRDLESMIKKKRMVEMKWEKKSKKAT